MNKMMGNKKAIFLFTMPALLVFTLIVFYPILQTFQKSFYDWDGLTEAVFCGFDNYITLLKDPLFYQSTKNGLIFAGILVVFQMGLATLLALALMNTRVPFRRFFRSAYFIPVVLSVTVVCQLWSSIYNPEFGLINKLLLMFHLPEQDWLSNPKTVLAAVAFVNVWQCMGYQFAIIYAGAKSIPDQYWEAAKIDGATNTQMNIKVVLPMLVDTYRMCLIFAITGGLNAYGHMSLLTKGGPGTSSFSLTYMTFRSAFTIGDYGYGCSVAVALVLQCLLATIFINRFMGKDEITY